MSKRVPASMRTRASLHRLIESRAATADGLGDLVILAMRLILEERWRRKAVTPWAGRITHTARSQAAAGGNGVQTGRLKTVEGFVEYAVPPITGRVNPFRSEISDVCRGAPRRWTIWRWHCWLAACRCSDHAKERTATR